VKYYRRLPPFEYLGPTRADEACGLLKKFGNEVRVLAGGTIVLHQMKERIGVRKYVMGLKSIHALNEISANEVLVIGAMALHQDIADSLLVKEYAGLLGTTCGRLGTAHIRNMGSIGGNICSRFTTAETLPALVALGAEVKLVSTEGERMVPVEGLYKELRADEILTEVRIGRMTSRAKAGYEKFAWRERYDYATISAAVILTLDGDVCIDSRVGLGGVTLPTMRPRRSEEALKGKRLERKVIDEAANAASEDGRAGADLYFSSEYKKELIRVMMKRAIVQALTGDEGGEL
jgi:carbon-monoxide dehydrogenase medium subunit